MTFLFPEGKVRISFLKEKPSVADAKKSLEQQAEADLGKFKTHHIWQ